MPTTLNINQQVRVTLWKTGVTLWQKHWADVRMDPPAWAVGETRVLQLWEVAHIFGPRLTMGFDPPISPEMELLGE